jgi:hypothetical protein
LKHIEKKWNRKRREEKKKVAAVLILTLMAGDNGRSKAGRPNKTLSLAHTLACSQRGERSALVSVNEGDPLGKPQFSTSHDRRRRRNIVKE